ncbi:MAG: stringent starvation protein A [Gammaproteobacteria bacterium]|nr:stringent starvation protein A [Gammaproteobacteria bacterium]
MSLMTNRRSVMVFFSEAGCPESHSVRLVLAEKGVNAEIESIEPENKPEDLADINPYSEILTLADRDVVLYDIYTIMEYLDERYPHPPLMPVDPVSRAHNRLYRYRIRRDLFEPFKVMQYGSQKKAAAAKRHIRATLADIAPAFSQKPFFMSDEYSLVDCYIGTLLWRLPAFGINLAAQDKSLYEYSQRMFVREAFTRSLTEVDHERQRRK